jgi:transposase
MIRNAPKEVAVFGVDLGKNVFHVVGLDDRGAVVQRVKFRRDTLLVFFERASRSIVGMEACPGSQWLARKLQAMGHRVRIVPAQFVKPYIMSQKNDTIDADAIAEAVTRPTMRFTQVRTVEQVDLQALHRIRDQLVSSRTRLIMRRMLSELFDDVVRLDQRIAGAAREIEGLAARDDRARRLMTIPGIGPLAATALLAAIGDGSQFRRARDLAAWLGLVPREYSTGGKTKLLGISKRGNRYVRRLLIHGARSCVTHLDRTRDRLGGWLDALQSRMHVNKVTVALAAKIARTAWAIITRPGALYERRDPVVA